MKSAAETGILCRVATARMPTKWGMFNAAGFERAANGSAQIDTALALIMCDLSRQAPLLRIHSQCFTGEGLGSLRCDCSGQLSMAMRAIAAEGHGLVIYEYQEGRGSDAGIEVVTRIPCETKPNSYSLPYLRTKKEKWAMR
jgi:GTP cyclohydrolase II